MGDKILNENALHVYQTFRRITNLTDFHVMTITYSGKAAKEASCHHITQDEFSFVWCNSYI